VIEEKILSINSPENKKSPAKCGTILKKHEFVYKKFIIDLKNRVDIEKNRYIM